MVTLFILKVIRFSFLNPFSVPKRKSCRSPKIIMGLVLVRVKRAAGFLGPLAESQVDLLGLGHPVGVIGRNEGIEHGVEGRGGHGLMVSRQ